LVGESDGDGWSPFGETPARGPSGAGGAGSAEALDTVEPFG
jgi:hypothetical protein